MIKIGFTGTRNGMDEEQLKEFERIIKSKHVDEFHHGMCVGSDKQAHDFVKNEKINGVFIRAPIIKKVGKKVEILAKFEKNPVLIKQGNVIVGSFHPETEGKTIVHKLLISLIKK